MKFFLACLLALLLPAAAWAANPAADAAAAAKAWLVLVDKGDYAQSWAKSHRLLQGNVTAEQWTAAAKPIHDQLGATLTRDETGVDLMTSLPGVPEGHYAIVHFRTKFEKKGVAVENVTMALDGTVWKAAGYFIQ